MRLLVTSREVLNLPEEWVYQVRGMSLPDRPGFSEADESGAVRLFAERAGQIRRGSSSEAAGDDVLRICRLVDGMPLALELAAFWTRYLPCSAITDENQGNVDFLETSPWNVPERHRRMRAVFEQSWQRLDDPEQRAVLALSVFRGGFSRSAAEAVAGASLSFAATAHVESPSDELTPREVEVPQLIARGHTNREIAQRLTLGAGTTKWYTSQIYGKLGVRNRSQAVLRTRELGVVL